MTESILAQPEHCEALGDALTRAFADDPLCSYVFPNRTRRLQKMRWIYVHWLRLFISRRLVYTTPELSGAALWHRPEQGFDIGVWEQVQAGFLPVLFLLHPAEHIRGFRAHHDAVARMKQFVDKPHWVLDTLGVAPDYHRKGIARTMLQPVMDQADAVGIPCFVNTHNSVNVPFYERLGFKVIHESLMPGSDITVYSFCRPPQSNHRG